ncbi:hypothetical protein AB205_0129050, partial [Aquarana catesbeiana]
KVLQRRWKSLRDRVRRDLREEEKPARSGASAPKRKPHVYHQNLAFIRQAMISSIRETISNIGERREEAGEVRAVDRPTTSVTDSSAHTSPRDSSVESLAEEATHEQESSVSQHGEVHGRGGVRGPGRGRNQRQRVGEFVSETETRVLALQQEVRQERRSFDAFLDPSNKLACFCRHMYNLMEDMGGHLEI